MKKTSRKQQLSDRSFRYAYGVTRDEVRCDDPHATRSAYAWQDGYRAAMRDLRKIVRHTEAELDTGFTSDPFRRMQIRYASIAVLVKKFLRPLR